MAIKFRLFLNELLDKFKLNVLMNNQNLNEIEIKNSNIVRGCFELTGETVYDNIISILYFGKKEFLYLKKFDINTIKNRIAKVLLLKPPVLFIGPNFAPIKELLLEVASKSDIPIIETDWNLQILHTTIGNWIQEKLSSYNLYHGSLVSVFGTGTLIMGKSAIGKSEVTVELVKKGHIFIGDDAILITRIGKRLFGRPDEKTKNFIEIRGLGILNFQRVFGIEKQIRSSRINVICELVDFNAENHNSDFERIGSKINYKNIEGIDVPYYRIPILKGRNISEMIETAVTDLKLKKQGYYSSEEFMKQILSIEKRKKY